MTLKVDLNTKVTLHFTLQLESGELIDSTREKSPATFVFGDGSLLPSFEKMLLGMSEGDSRSFVLPADQAFGKYNPDNLHSIPRTQFESDINLEEGLLVSFRGQAGEELPGLVKNFNEQFVRIDFNHPLAGKEIIFEAEILAIEALKAEALVDWIGTKLAAY